MILIKTIKYFFRIIKEFLYILIIRLIYFKKYLNINNPGLYKKYITTKKDIGLSLEYGISGFYRVKNEEKTLELSVESHIRYLDEIIIVYNDSNDNTPQIALNLQKKYPEKIKVFEYEPKVFPPESLEQILAKNNSVYGLANYYNFTISKITKKIAIKIDADHICIENEFNKTIQKIKSERLDTMIYFYGVNVIKKDNKIFVNKNKPFTYGFDCGFFPLSQKTYFINRQKCETLVLPLKMYFTRKSAGVLFYHVKFMKKDFELIENNMIIWGMAKNKYSKMLYNIPYPKI
ncbi:MAG TPA: glycosyltransferase [Candidatus Paceibacterota bacterium]|nr:glycosyltransferase [Candidatus Paceibacterota bacterium]HMP19092.1 glycosyltransferase [Candidatus Paceibacterota bacterium]